MSESARAAPPVASLDPAVAAFLKLFGDRVRSVTVAVVNGNLRHETTITLAPGASRAAMPSRPQIDACDGKEVVSFMRQMAARKRAT